MTLAPGYLLLLTFLLFGMMLFDRIALSCDKVPGEKFNAILFLLILTAIGTHALLLFGWVWCVTFFAVTLLIPYLAEALGLRYGVIFGRYEYTEKIGPKGIFGVPYAVAAIWPVVLYIGFLESLLLTGLGHTQAATVAPWVLALMTAAIATLSDLVIEPIMVDNGYWVWSPMQKVSGWKWGTIPLINFVSWFLTSFVTVFVALQVTTPIPYSQFPEPWFLALPLLWIGLACLYSIGEAKRIHRTGIAKLCLMLGLGAFALYLLFTLSH